MTRFQSIAQFIQMKQLNSNEWQLEKIDDFPHSCRNGSAARVGSTSICRTSSTPVVTVEATIKLHHRNRCSAITFNLSALLPRLSSRIREHPWRHLPRLRQRFNFNSLFRRHGNHSRGQNIPIGAWRWVTEYFEGAGEAFTVRIEGKLMITITLTFP